MALIMILKNGEKCTLPSLKKLPMVGGSDHEGHPATKTDIGIQVEFSDDLKSKKMVKYLWKLNLMLKFRL